jgi:hypothetical protein
MKTKEAGSYKVRPHALVSTDDATMYADFIASVPEVDREDEVIHPEDFNVSEWMANPVWLWAHDKSKPPIGAGYKADGTPAVQQSPERLILGCRFSQANPQGALTYALYKEGTLKMVSVGFLNTETKAFPGTTYGHPRPVKRIMDPELVECSCVPIGMNRSAMLLSIKGKGLEDYVDPVGLASVLDNGHLHGEKVPEDMRRTLEPFAERIYTKSGEIPRFKFRVSENKIPKFSSQLLTKGLALPTESGGPAVASIATKAPLKAGKVPEPEVKEAAPAPAASQMPEPQLSAGAQTYKAGMEALVGVAKGMSEMIAQSDNPEIQKSIKAHASAAAALVKAMYGDAMKYFEANKDIFVEPATLAAQYEILQEEPDAAMANTEEEADMQDDIKAEDATEDAPPEKPSEPDADDAADGEDDTEDEKAVDVVITKSVFTEWEDQKFAELNAKIERLEALLEVTTDLAVKHTELLGTR